MKGTKLLTLTLLLGTLTGCYPTGEAVSLAEFNYDEDLNASPRDDLIYKLVLPEDYAHEFDVSKAKRRYFDAELAPQILPENNRIDLNDRTDNEFDKATVFQTGDSLLGFYPGSVTYWDDYHYMCTAFANLHGSPMPRAAFRELFPNTELSFSSDDAIAEANRIAELLDVKLEEPEIYALDKTASKTLINYYDDSAKIEKDCYFINFPILIGGIPSVLMNSTHTSSHIDWYIESSNFSIQYSKDGVQELQCYGILDVTEKCDPITIQPPEFAVAQIKQYFEDTAEPGVLLGCELRALPYRNMSDPEDVFTIRPVWQFGWTNGTDLDESLPYIRSYFVDAETGVIY